MSFEARLLGKTRLREYRRCLELIDANAGLAPVWERLCLSIYVSAGPFIARLLGVDTTEIWKRAEGIIGDVFAVTSCTPEEVARLLREYVRLRRERADHLPFEDAREHIYERPFYPVVTHFTYALQPSAAARLDFVREAVGSVRAERARVADLGCGSGVILSEVLMMRPGWVGHGLDISEASIRYARGLAEHKGVAGRADFRRGDITELPYPDESLDLIIASEVIEHMPEPGMVVREIARTLSPGGKLVLTMPLESHTPAHINALGSREELRGLCEAAGLRVSRIEPRWHFGFGDDRRHVFALAESDDRVRAPQTVGFNPVGSPPDFCAALPEPGAA